MDASPRLLAVDDSPTIRKAFELILGPAGYAVEFAATGAEGLAKARALQPTIVLLDFILPDLRGSEVARELLQDTRTAHIPVILISSKGAEIRQAYRDIANVVAFITKPFTPDQVLNAISDVLAHVTTGGFHKTLALEPAPPPNTGASLASPTLAASAAPVAALNGAGAGAAAPAPDESWNDLDAGAGDDEDAPRVNAGACEAAHAPLQRMFETLLAGLEGVYVEEVDTPAGAVADQAKSYTDLAARLTRQLSETLEHAKAGARFGLCSDGSVQSLADRLLDMYRRVCRLLFRAVAAGAVDNEFASRRARLLVARHPDGEAVETLLAPTAAEWHVCSVASDFRQLPLMTRLYGPTHLIVEAVQHAALWDQLRLVRALPEGRGLRMIGITTVNTALTAVDAATLAELGVEAVVESGPGLRDALRAHIEHPSPTAMAPTPLAPEAGTAATSAL
jgi:CheY-like chemotaxis protein